MKRIFYIAAMIFSSLLPIMALNVISYKTNLESAFSVIFSSIGLINCLAAILLLNRNKKALSFSNLILACFFFITVAARIIK